MASFNLVSRKGAEVLECAALAWYWVRATDLLRLNTLLPLPHHLPPRTEFHFHIKPEDDTIPPKMTIVCQFMMTIVEAILHRATTLFLGPFFEQDVQCFATRA